jgi:hypothetical protein
MFERMMRVHKLWAMAADGVEPPSDDKVEFWCHRYSDAEIEHALSRAVKKLRKGTVVRSTSEVERYVSGVLRHEAEKSTAGVAA